MNLTVTINIGVTPQLAQLLGALTGQNANSVASEPERPAATEALYEKLETAMDEAVEEAAKEPERPTVKEPERPTVKAPAKRERASKGSAPTAGDASNTSSEPASGPTTADATASSEAPKADPFATKPTAGAAAQGVGDPFSTQVKAAVAEAAAEGSPSYTVKDLNDAASAAMGRGVKVAKIKERLVELKIVTADGEPVDRLQVVQPKDYGTVIGALNELA